MRKEKQFLLDEMKDKLIQTVDFIMTSYRGIDPNTAWDFRISIIDSGGIFQVVKKRVFLKAAKEAGIEIDKEILKGHIGIVYSGSDTVATTKAVHKFKKENDKLLDILGGQFEGKLCSPGDLKEISALPSQEQMRAEFLGVMEAPLSELVSVMTGVMTGVVNCMDQQVQKKESKS
ncbi:MAG: 50S ribosomal protein L10 [Chlamydiota bacterium]